MEQPDTLALSAFSDIQRWLTMLSLPPVAILYLPPPAAILPAIIPGSDYLELSPMLKHWHLFPHLSTKQLLAVALALGRTL